MKSFGFRRGALAPTPNVVLLRRMLTSRGFSILVLGLCSAGCGQSFGPDGGAGSMDGSPADRDARVGFDGAAPSADGAAPLADGAAPLADGATPSADAGPALPEDCTSGTAAPCGCAMGRGFRYCTETGWSADCECPVPPGVATDGGTDFPDASLPCTGDPEWCDGADNDCDGLIDEGYVCPDSTVHAALPFSGTVYGYFEYCDTTCYHYSFFPIAPAMPDESPREADVEIDRTARVLFRPDGELAYLDSEGTVWRIAEGADPEIPTPPCFSGVPWFDFDGAGRFYYLCGTTVRRGNGEIVHAALPSSPDLFDDSRVLASGRIIARVGSNAHVILELDGTTSAPWSPTGWSGTMIFANYVYDTQVQGESAFLVYRRTYRGGTRNELVIFRADGAAHTFTLMRRIPVGEFPEDGVALPDGRFIGGFWRGELTDYPTDGPPLRLGIDPTTGSLLRFRRQMAVRYF